MVELSVRPRWMMRGRGEIASMLCSLDSFDFGDWDVVPLRK